MGQISFSEKEKQVERIREVIPNRKRHSIGSNYRMEHPVSTHRNHGLSVSVLKNSHEKDAEPIFNHPGTRQDNPSELPPIEVDATS